MYNKPSRNYFRKIMEEARLDSQNPFIEEQARKTSQRVLHVIDCIKEVQRYCSETECTSCDIRHHIECGGELKSCSSPRNWGYYINQKSSS